MRYYDSVFRENLLELLSNYRKMLNQASVASQDQNYIILIANTVKQVDEAIKTAKPSAFDFLTERKIAKIQEAEFTKAKREEIEKEITEKLQKKIMQECREKLTEEIRAELTPKIKEELKKEREEKKKRKKAKKEEANLKLIQSQLITSLQTAFSGTSENPDDRQLTSSATDNLSTNQLQQTDHTETAFTENDDLYDDVMDDGFGDDSEPDSID